MVGSLTGAATARPSLRRPCSICAARTCGSASGYRAIGRACGMQQLSVGIRECDSDPAIRGESRRRVGQRGAYLCSKGCVLLL